MLDKLIYHIIYPGFFKLIAPVEIKIALFVIIIAAVIDRLKKYLSGPIVHHYNYIGSEIDL